MIILQCEKCGSLNLITSNRLDPDVECVDCGNRGYVTSMKLYESIDNTVINLGNPFWISKEGTKYEFKEMSKEHLKNTINMLKRSYPSEELKGTETFKGLCQEYIIRD